MNHPNRKKQETIEGPVMAWWFAASDTLPHGDGRKVILGETLRVEPPIIPCERGLHASVCPLDALKYAPGEMLYRVRLSGLIVPHDGDKLVASERTALAVIDATATLRAFARKMALSVIHLWNAPAIVREYLTTGDESKRAAAGDAAWAAARAAATDAAGKLLAGMLAEQFTPPCPGCDGTGKVEDARQHLITCPTCGGAGTVERGR